MKPAGGHTVEVCFSPKLFSEILTTGEFIIVLADILRATTSICYAFMNGVERILPVATIEEARQKKDEGFLVASEQDGKKLDFADFGNSAFSFTREKVEGKALVYCTTNGTRALEVARESGNPIAIGAFSNLTALKEWLVLQDKNVVILCSGWKNKFCLEDSVYAGALAEILLAEGFVTVCDSARAALDLWNTARTDLPHYIDKAMHRERLRSLGLDDVIPYSLKTDTTGVVPVFTGAEIVNANRVQSFKWQTEQFADARILRYQVPGFEQLSLKQKELVYYLSQAALCGRDITYDQKYHHNLLVRKTCEAILTGYPGDRDTGDFRNFEIYLKRVWFSNGIHHHTSMDKILPGITPEYFATLVKSVPAGSLPGHQDQSVEQFLAEVTPVIFDPETAPKRVTLDPGRDLVLNSACNFYEGVDEQEVEGFYASLKSEDQNAGRDTRVSYGLNSKVIKENGKIAEKTWKAGGMYSPAIRKIIFWLEKALVVTETPEQKAATESLMAYYKSGNLVTWDEYNLLWLKDLDSSVDFVNGFIETYGDPLAMKASWEAMVNFRNEEATKRTEIISARAQYFEDHSPVDPRFKRREVKGVTAKVITVVQLGGDCDPTTPIGINLPNAEWIRKEHGSKSVTMENITYAYEQASLGNGFLEEFAASPEEITRAKEYGFLAGNLTTDMHECLGHASGQLLPGTSPDALKNYHSTLEEARADLFALYYITDPELISLGLVPSSEVGKTEYDSFMRNGYLTQLVRIGPGRNVEEAHMRDRKLIATWCHEHGKKDRVTELFTKEGKTFIRVNDYDALRKLFGELLGEIQRIKSEGDYPAGRELVERYGVSVDRKIHEEMLERYKKLNIAPHAGFINPVLTPVYRADTISDVLISYPDDFTEQMLWYSKEYSFLPVKN
jgi:dipeptidyl-peptidase III